MELDAGGVLWFQRGGYRFVTSSGRCWRAQHIGAGKQLARRSVRFQTSQQIEGGACFPAIEAVRFVKGSEFCASPQADDVPLGQKSTLIPKSGCAWTSHGRFPMPCR